MCKYESECRSYPYKCSFCKHEKKDYFEFKEEYYKGTFIACPCEGYNKCIYCPYRYRWEITWTTGTTGCNNLIYSYNGTKNKEKENNDNENKSS